MRWRTGDGRRDLAAAVVPSLILVAGVAGAVFPAAMADGATATPTTSAVSDLQQFPGNPGAPPLPAACNLSWPTKAWPPKVDAQAGDRVLRPSDLPAGMRESPAPLATTPNLDELAMGWPQGELAEVASSTSPSVSTGAGSTIDEIVGRARGAAQATATYRKARDLIFGSCVRYWPGNEGRPRYPVPWAGSSVFAFEESDQEDHGFSRASVVLLGHRGRFDFELDVGNFVDSPDDPTDAPIPTRAQLAAALTPALARLGA
jgi:hypothetical protein